MPRAAKLQPKLFTAGAVLTLVVCWGVCVLPANLSSEWVHIQSCFCFWRLLSWGRTIPPCPLLSSSSPSPSPPLVYLSIIELWGSYLIYSSFCYDMTAGLWRKAVCTHAQYMCLSKSVPAHISVRETLMVFHGVKTGKKGHKSKQPECRGEANALMLRCRHISVFHVERCESRGNVTTNKINVNHKQAKRNKLWESYTKPLSAQRNTVVGEEVLFPVTLMCIGKKIICMNNAAFIRTCWYLHRYTKCI